MTEKSQSEEAVGPSSMFSYHTSSGEVVLYAVPQHAFVEILTGEMRKGINGVNSLVMSKRMAVVQNELFIRSNRFDVSTSEAHLFAHLRLFAVILKGLSLLDGAVRDIKPVLAVLLKLSGPELDFEEILDELLQQCKSVLQVDRVGLYVVDKMLSSMVLYVSQGSGRVDSNPSSPSSQFSAAKSFGSLYNSGILNVVKRSNGIRMPLKGLAAHVAIFGQPLNIPDAYQDKNFDPSMDLRTGYRTRQVLCVPVKDHLGDVISVLQFINTADGRPFTTNDMLVADLLAKIISSKSYLIKLRASINSYKPINKSTDKFRLQLLSAVTEKPHRHLKLTASLFVGMQQYGPTQRSDIFPTVPFVGRTTDRSLRDDGEESVQNRMSRCVFNSEISFSTSFGGSKGLKDVELSNLPQSGRIFIELFSKNNHPVAWTSINMFDFDRTLQTGALEAILVDGPRPTSMPECIAASCELQQTKIHHSEFLRLGDGEMNVLSVAFPTFDTVNVARDFDLSARYYSPFQRIPSMQPGDINVNSVDWYMMHMTAMEKKKYLAIVDLYAHQVLSPGTDIDWETSQLIWRMRTALCVECAWALPIFLLSVDWLNADAAEDAYRLL